MIATIIISFITSWILSYGITFAYFQDEWPEIKDKYYYRDMTFSIFFCYILAIILNIFGILLVYFLSKRAKHGLKFW